MRTLGALQIDPGTLDGANGSQEMEIVVPFTEWAVTEAALRKVTQLTAGLNVRVTLVAVHTAPYPASFWFPAAIHAYLVEQLTELASRCPFPVTPQVVLARGREEGLCFVLKPESTVLLGARRHFWRTSEERLARTLAHVGHKVVLMHVD